MFVSSELQSPHRVFSRLHVCALCWLAFTQKAAGWNQGQSGFNYEPSLFLPTHSYYRKDLFYLLSLEPKGNPNTTQNSEHDVLKFLFSNSTGVCQHCNSKMLALCFPLSVTLHVKCPVCIFSEYLEVVWRSLASENTECPILVKKASDTLVARLKDPTTFDNITKDFKYSAVNFFIFITVFSEM